MEKDSGKVLKWKGTNFLLLESILWKNVCTSSCPSAGYSRNEKEHDGFFSVDVSFPRYHLSYSAATGWLSWNLIYFPGLCNPCSLSWWSYMWTSWTNLKKKSITVQSKYISDCIWTAHSQRLSIHLFLHNQKKQRSENSMWKWLWLLFSAYLKGCLNHTAHSKSV